MPEFTYEEYVQYLESNDGDSSAVMGLVDGPTTERTLKKLNPEAYARYQQFAKRLLAENKAFIEDYHANKEGKTDAMVSTILHCMMHIYQASTMAPYLALTILS